MELLVSWFWRPTVLQPVSVWLGSAVSPVSHCFPLSGNDRIAMSSSGIELVQLGVFQMSLLSDHSMLL